MLLGLKASSWLLRSTATLGSSLRDGEDMLDSAANKRDELVHQVDQLLEGHGSKSITKEGGEKSPLKCSVQNSMSADNGARSLAQRANYILQSLVQIMKGLKYVLLFGHFRSSLPHPTNCGLTSPYFQMRP